MIDCAMLFVVSGIPIVCVRDTHLPCLCLSTCFDCSGALGARLEARVGGPGPLLPHRRDNLVAKVRFILTQLRDARVPPHVRELIHAHVNGEARMPPPAQKRGGVLHIGPCPQHKILLRVGAPPRIQRANMGHRPSSAQSFGSAPASMRYRNLFTRNPPERGGRTRVWAMCVSGVFPRRSSRALGSAP